MYKPYKYTKIFFFHYLNYSVLLHSGVDVISEKGRDKKNDIALWEGKIPPSRRDIILYSARYSCVNIFANCKLLNNMKTRSTVCT